MLKFLNISNIAVIPRLEAEFHFGLNLLTGETGAGKSIIIDALGSLLGGRVAAEMIRSGEQRAIIEGVFELSAEQDQGVGAILAEAGIDSAEDSALIVRREISAGGRSRAFLNDRSVTAATVRLLQPFLIEIQGQGEQHTLTTARTHMELLDSFAEVEELRGSVAESFARWKNAATELRSFEENLAARARAEDLLRYQLNEIERIAPRPGEDEELEKERALLAQREKVLQLRAEAYNELYESDQSALSRLASVRRALEKLAQLDAGLRPAAETLESYMRALEEVAGVLRSYGTYTDFSPARLMAVENRLVELERLIRKYGDLTGALRYGEELRAQLKELDESGEREQMLREDLERSARQYRELAGKLSAARRAAAPELERRVQAELAALAMERAQFAVSWETSAEGAAEEQYTAFISHPQGQARWTAQGIDRVEFLFSANEGEAPRPLARVASGGELSRLMLAISAVRRGEAPRRSRKRKNAGPTLIFDEVDAGIGGKVAEAIGRRLKALAATRQVLCVTHLPQIACFADHHLAITKNSLRGRAVTHVREVTGEERVRELARMLGGADDLQAARETARWLIKSARGV